VLWLGQVNLRKGIQYVAPAARLLPGVDFEIAGPLAISDKAVAEFPPNVRFLGRITRDRTVDLYRQADVFILPTVSDGFALTQLEAMAQGVPVVTTPNCGDVVTDGKDGLIVPARDSEALARAIALLDSDRSLLESMSAATARKLPQFSASVCIGQIEAAAAKALAARRAG
jgi:glycosyltransferase involved in cell wall biosynthesis